MKVLIADDSLVMRRLLEASLASWGYDVVCVNDGEAAWDALKEEDAPPIAILDWMMPGHSGLEICRMVRSLTRPFYTYVILLTARGLREDLVEGLGAGADDYVVKPFDKHELEVRLRAGRRIVELQSELLRAQEALREQATRDALTKIWNRRSILEILAREGDRAAREGAALGLLMVDIDHFKSINDSYGHQAGDQVLGSIAARLAGAVRSYDSIGRYGGEEFLIVVPRCSGPDLMSQANRIRESLCQEAVEIGGITLRITASIGASCWEAGTPVAIESLIRAADSALYQAKDAGRNAALFASPSAEPQRVD